jgi:hypothetical protein
MFYNIEVFGSRAERCKERSILFKESRFLIMEFLAGANLLPHPPFCANSRTSKLRKLKPGIKGADHHDFSFDIP